MEASFLGAGIFILSTATFAIMLARMSSGRK
jgi:hypothetical protein